MEDNDAGRNTTEVINNQFVISITSGMADLTKFFVIVYSIKTFSPLSKKENIPNLLLNALILDIKMIRPSFFFVWT